MGERPALDEIIALSRFYGRDAEWVIAGGGNTSVKNDTTLMVKASGSTLAAASGGSFVAVDRTALGKIWTKHYPEETEEREREALADLLDARFPGQEGRPSVETGMHDALPYALVVHTHPPLVNGITCSRRGEATVRELFGDEAVWISSTNPGVVLSKKVREAVRAFESRYGKAPQLVFVENHGLVVSADTALEVHRLHARVVERILPHLLREPDLSACDVALDEAARVKEDLRQHYRRLTGTDVVVLFDTAAELCARAESPDEAEAVLAPFSPDHIVYVGHAPLYVETADRVATDFEGATKREGIPPKCILVRGLGLFTVGPSLKIAEAARMLFRDAVKIAAYAESFGGPKAMPPEEVEFIRGWEVERFRASVSLDTTDTSDTE